MKKTYKKNSDVNYQILDAYTVVHCDCGEDIYMDFRQPSQCSTCDKMYDMSVEAYELIETQVEKPGLIGIISDDLRISKDFLYGLSSKIPLGTVEGVRDIPRGLEVILKNGDTYRIFKADDDYWQHLRGLWFKKLYVHDRLKGQRFLQDLMAHCDKEIDYFVL